MALPFDIMLFATPTALYLGLILALREQGTRSPGAAEFAPRRRDLRPPLVVAGAAIGLFLCTPHARADVLCLLIVLTSVVGSLVVERKLLTTFADIVRVYLNPGHWTDLDAVGPHWRYQMQRRFIEDPEYVDSLTIDLFRQHESYGSFVAAVQADDYPPDRSPLLDKRFWGALFPTTRALVRDVVVGEVLNNRGRFSSGKSGQEIYVELQQLVDHPDLLMDRWQYYWCLRNLNYIDAIFRRAFSTRLFLAITVIAGVMFASVAGLARPGYAGWSLILSGIAGGLLAWLLFVCAGSSLLIVRVFGGTGTFVISYPCRGIDFDPLWSRVIQVGIVSFTVSFIVYGMGSPMLLDPAVLAHFELDDHFLAYAAGSFFFCALVFIMHTAGIHALMLGSRNNALDRIATRLHAERESQAVKELAEHFRDVRALRVWPVRSTTLPQLAAGIVLPVMVQIILLYTGVKGR
jgi:hypothetical protein